MAMKPFLLDLPKTIGSNNNGCMGSNSGSSGGGGGLQVPDGSTAHSTYLNLPSPNIQSEIQDVNPVLRKLSVLSKQPELILQQQQQQQKKQQEQLQSGQLHNHHNYKYSNRSNDNSRKSGNSRKSCDKQIDDNDDYLLYNYDDQELMAPDEQPSVEELQRRRRRRALVPPKLITDGPSIDDDDAGSDKSITTSITNDNDNNDFGQQLSPINNQSSFIDNSISNKSKQSQRNSLPSFNVEITGCSNQSSIGIEQTSDVSISDHHSSGGGDNVHDDDNKCKSISPEIRDHYYDDGRKSPRSDDHSSPPSSSSSNLLGVNLNSPSNNKNNRRRSSVVVIPPMQICPGDLLVYSKVLTQRANLIAECGGGGFASSLLTDHDNRKSHKNTWSLLRLCVQFDRSGSRSKADQILCGLEEFLSNLAPSNSFFDESMLRYRGISWYEFQSRLEKRRISNDCSSTTSSSAISLINALSLGQTTNQPNQQYHSRFIDNSRFSSLQSNTLDTIAVNCPLCHRTQTIMIPAIPQPVVPPSQPPPPPTTTGLLTTNMPKAASYSVDRLLIQPNDTNLINGTENQTKYEVQSAKYYQRTDSVSTEQEVESIVDFEIADNPTTTAVVDQQHQQQNLEPLQPSSNSKTQQPINSGFTMNSNDIYGPGPAPEPSQFCRDCFQQFKREKRRREALWELFQSELLFLVDHLMVLKNVFMEPLKNIQVEGYAMFAEPEVLFGNLDELCLVTYAFCKEFLSLLIQQESSGDGIQVTNILNKLYLKNNRIASSTQAYHRYTLNYINALQYLETLRRHLEFIEFEKWCNRDPRCKKLQLTDLLVTPVQHVMRIPLLLKEIESKTYQSDEKRIIQSIIEQQEHSLRELDDKMRWLKNFERLLEIQRNILWPSVLDMDPKVFVPEFLKSFLQKQPCERLIVSPRRQIILEGPLMIMDSGKSIEMYVFLFDDLLLITRRKKGLGKKQSTLTDRWVTNCSGRSSSYSSVVGGSVGASNVVNPSASIAVATTMITGAVTNTNINNVITNVPGTGSISTAAAAAIAGAGTIVTSAAAAAAVTSGHHFTSGSLPGGSHHVITTTTASAGSITQTGINLMSLHGEPHHGPLTGGGGSISGGGGGGGGSSNNAACFKYVVYKQPLSLDRFYIHDVPGSDGSGSGSGSGGGSGSGSSSSNNSGLKNAFVLVCLNRFQQVITVHTFQASSESAKHTWLSKLRSTCDRWKRTLQSNQVFRSQKQSNTSGKNDTTAESQKSSSQRRQQQQQPKNDSEPSISYQIDDSQLTATTFT
uniref:Uncharacterized protein LOC113790227 n=1 Tax=Dermatophagoides pteronyssinus TaxID=6956 RepID=A0A6P6XS76_DERPT|nr:uncharacterized protein LOC113790227 [Dermatophagoides pteronyssinus]